MGVTRLMRVRDKCLRHLRVFVQPKANIGPNFIHLQCQIRPTMVEILVQCLFRAQLFYVAMAVSFRHCMQTYLNIQMQ